jgi:hypothetical protein
MKFWALDGKMTLWPSPEARKPPLMDVSSEAVELLLYVKLMKSRFMGLAYKVHKSSNKLSALQLLFTQGYCSPVFKAKFENYDNMQTVLLPAGRRVSRVMILQVDRETARMKLMMDNGKPLVTFYYLENSFDCDIGCDLNLDIPEDRQISGVVLC